ncbi:MAG: 2-phosphosulfolactate phosphatase [Firmicutes bacterium]|nr:2-phosphosulfolactate phosphatase [Alicyclobacillaceae bacterium]MCL6496393.1 2-phosphosulfolactate phosphatase [Bacillota bacterium]
MAVVDTLRATTTMVTILAHGGTAVLPVAEMEQALALRARYPEALVGGERNNRRPKGFDAGNSPREYGSERVAGRRVILTTSNGTQAIARCVGAAWLAAAALVNASAAAQALTAVGDEALVVCAGGHGHPALEDVLAAGALVEQWPEEGWGDGARIAVAVWRQHRRDLLGALRTAAHGRELEAMHLEGDIEDAARVDDFAVVPVRGADGWFYAGP